MRAKGLCAIDDCGKAHYSRGWCRRHYGRWLRHGDPTVFLQKVYTEPAPHEKTHRPCSAEGCRRGHFALGYCAMHWSRFRKYGTTELPDRHSKRLCSVDGCGRKHKARGYCDKHHQRWAAHGDPLVRLNRGPGDAEGYLDKTDGYRRRYAPGRGKVKEHRLVMEAALGRELLPHETVHHINGVRDDNRLENLELWSSSHPHGQRVEDKVAWALDMIRQYQPHLLAENFWANVEV